MLSLGFNTLKKFPPVSPRFRVQEVFHNLKMFAMVLQKSDNGCRGFLRCLGPGKPPEMQVRMVDVFSRKARRHLQHRNRGVGAVEDSDLQQIFGAALSIAGIENALGVCTVRADGHNYREFLVRALLHNTGFSKTGLKSRQERMKG